MTSHATVWYKPVKPPLHAAIFVCDGRRRSHYMRFRRRWFATHVTIFVADFVRKMIGYQQTLIFLWQRLQIHACILEHPSATNRRDRTLFERPDPSATIYDDWGVVGDAHTCYDYPPILVVDGDRRRKSQRIWGA